MAGKSLGLQRRTVPELFQLYCGVLDELRRRGIARSTNNPVADYAEVLCERALRLKRSDKSTKGYDGIDHDGRRIEIKGRRVTAHNGSRQLSAIRGLKDSPFDFLAGVLFREDFTVWKGCLIPIETIRKRARFGTHVNAWRFLLTDDVWSIPGTVDITRGLRRVESAIAGAKGVLEPAVR